MYLMQPLIVGKVHIPKLPLLLPQLSLEVLVNHLLDEGALKHVLVEERLQELDHFIGIAHFREMGLPCSDGFLQSLDGIVLERVFPECEIIESHPKGPNVCLYA